MAKQLYVLYEHASGFGLFHVDSKEEIGALLPVVEQSVTDFGIFNACVKMVAFSPFASGVHALENINAISEGVLHDDLAVFLDTNLPKKDGTVLGISAMDPALAQEIRNQLSVTCLGNDVVAEVIRGLRVHFPKMMPGLSLEGEEKAQLGLSHSYSRSKLKFNVHRNDNMIIQSIAISDQLDKDINTFSMRVKEWYGFHFPELVKIEPDNFKYCRLVDAIKDRASMSDDIADTLEEITQDAEKAQQIIIASKRSMGMDISPIDLINVQSFCTRVIKLTQYKQTLTQYLHKRMDSVAPNLSALIGDVVGARLISHAGSLTNLAKYPASTVQILGAEKALFRALKKRGNTPKYGLIFHSTFIGRAGLKNKGRISRFLANKCAMASRIDCFSDVPNSVFGQSLKEQVEERLKFYEDGTKPRKNAEVMHEALGIYNDFVSEQQKSEIKVEAEAPKSEKKKKKKKKSLAPEEIKVEIKQEETEAPKSEKKKKKKKAAALEEQNGSVVENLSAEKPKSQKKKKKKSLASDEIKVEIENISTEEAPKKKKKRKSDSIVAEDAADTPLKKKKKKKVAAE